MKRERTIQQQIESMSNTQTVILFMVLGLVADGIKSNGLRVGLIAVSSAMFILWAVLLVARWYLGRKADQGAMS